MQQLQHKDTTLSLENQEFNEIFVKKNSYLNSRKNELQSLGATDAQLNQAFTIHRAAVSYTHLTLPTSDLV